MKKELKRYYLTSYRGTREFIVQTKKEYEDILDSVNKYNRKVKNKFIIGNITCEVKEDGLHIVGHLYTKLKNASTISDLLEYTSKYSKEELAEEFKDKTGMKDGYIPDINIAYLENKDKGSKEKIHYDRRIKYLPVLYKEDRKYMSLEYIISCLRYHIKCRHFNILRGLANETRFNKNVSEEVEKLYTVIDKCENQNLPIVDVYDATKKLIDKYVMETEKDGTALRDEKGIIINSKRRVFDIGMYFKYCMDLSKKHVPTMYNEGPDRKKKEELKKQEEIERVKQLKKTHEYKFK